MTEEQFPIESSVLSSKALNCFIKETYFTDCSPSICVLQHRGVNDTYLFKHDDNEYYFKVYYYGLRTFEELQAEVEIVNHLKKDRISVSFPLETKAGHYIVKLNAPEGKRFGILYSAATGICVSNDAITDAMTKNLGAYFGRIHKSWDRIVKPVNRWKIDLKTFVDDSLEYMTPLKNYCSFDFQFIEEVAQATKDSIYKLDKQKILSSGLCHGDFYAGNIHFDEQKAPTLFDFDFSGYGWRAYDLSVFLGAFGWGCSRKAIEKRAIRKDIFFKEYMQYNQMNEREIESIFLFVPFRRIFNFGRLYAYFSESWGNDCLAQNFNEDICYLKKWVGAYGMV